MADDDDSNASTFASRSIRYYDRSPSIFTISEKSTKQRALRVLLNLYRQKDQWNKYGNLKLACRNTIILSPVNTWWWMTEIFIIFTVTAFTYEYFSFNWLVIVPAIVVALLEWMAFYKTCWRDPGVMPRPDFPTAFRNLIKVLATYNNGSSVVKHVVHANGSTEQLIFCWKCNHFRAVATCHCDVCDCCMIQQDHHCPVFGGCVAKNNLSSFHTMTISMGCFWLYTMGFCIYNMATTTESFVRSDIDGTDSQVKQASRITFYLVLAEISAVLTVPTLLSCIRGVLQKRASQNTENTPAKKPKEYVVEVLQFAVDNEYLSEEILQLREILNTDNEMAEELALFFQDFQNHNNLSSLLQQNATVV